MIERHCNQCGVSYPARRSTSKFCSEKCRNDSKTKPSAAASSDGAEGSSAEAEPVVEGVTAVVRAQLTEAGRLSTVLGQAALVLARRLDNANLETGSALATLTKQLQATMTAALDGVVKRDPDFLDELEQRRQDKLAKFSA